MSLKVGAGCRRMGDSKEKVRKWHWECRHMLTLSFGLKGLKGLKLERICNPKWRGYRKWALGSVGGGSHCITFIPASSFPSMAPGSRTMCSQPAPLSGAGMLASTPNAHPLSIDQNHLGPGWHLETIFERKMTKSVTLMKVV